MKSALALGKIDRILLAIYLVALLGLLMFPIGGREFRIFGIEADKWMHAALLGGFALLVRWNLRASRHPLFITIGAAFVVAAATEGAQALIAYRSAEMWDLLAGLLGAALGAMGMSRLMFFPAFDRLVGLLVATLGLMVAAFFALADVIGVGEKSTFGTLQIAGTALGTLIMVGGAVVYATGSVNRSGSR